VALGSAVFGIPGVILWKLNSKGANRKLIIEERSLETTQFVALTGAQLELVQAVQEDNKLLRAELKELRDEVSTLGDKLQERTRELGVTKKRQQNAEHLLRDLYELLINIVKRAGIELTPDEQEIIDQTLPNISAATPEE